MPAVPVPAPAEVAAAARDTGRLLALRWQMISSGRGRSAVVFGACVFATMLYLVANIGYAIRRFAENGVDTAAGQFAVNFVISLQRGELGAVGAAALGSALAASLFSPFTGAANVALANADELVAFRPRRLHRYFDALVTQAFSTIGVLQLLSLTAIASMLTLDVNRAPGLAVAWAVWPLLVLVSVAEGWLLEYAHRRAARTYRLAVSAAVLAVVGIALWLDPQHGRTLFGAGTAFSGAVRAAGQGDIGAILAAGAVIGTASAAAFLAGICLARAALALPAVPVARPRKPLVRRMPDRPSLALAQVLFLQLVRTSEIRRPLITVMALGIPVLVVTQGGPQGMTMLVIACPLAVALSWSVNVFGVLGSAMPWLASQPRAMKMLPRIAIATQVAMTVGIAALCYLPVAALTGFDNAVSLAAGLAVSTALTTRGSVHKAVTRPFLARMGSRGDTIVPPLTAVGYTFRFALLSGQLGVLALNQGNRPAVQAFMVVLFGLWASLRTLRLLRRWDDPAVKSSVIASVASA